MKIKNVKGSVIVWKHKGIFLVVWIQNCDISLYLFNLFYIVFKVFATKVEVKVIKLPAWLFFVNPPDHTPV